MKKNAGISNQIVTGLAGGITVLALIMLFLLRSAIGGTGIETPAYKEAVTRGQRLEVQFTKHVSESDIDVYWDRVNNALVCVQSKKTNVLFYNSSTKTVNSAEITYEGGDYQDKTTEEILNIAKDEVQKMFNSPEDDKSARTEQLRQIYNAANANPLCTGVQRFIVDTGNANQAVLTFNLEYAGEKKTEYYSKDITQAYMPAVASRHASQGVQ